MARGNKTNEVKSVKDNPINYKEFNITGTHQNDFTGRLYLDGTASDKGTRYGIGLTVNGITIVGAKLWVPKDTNKDCSIMWPQYVDKNGDYHDYIKVFNKDDIADIIELANKLAELLG